MEAERIAGQIDDIDGVLLGRPEDFAVALAVAEPQREVEVAEPELRIGSYINFVTRMMLVLGLVFETPLVVMGLAKLRVVTAGQLIRRWRFALVGSFLVSAIVTPTIDPVTQSLVAGPMIVLYFIGAGLAWLVRR